LNSGIKNQLINITIKSSLLKQCLIFIPHLFVSILLIVLCLYYHLSILFLVLSQLLILFLLFHYNKLYLTLKNKNSIISLEKNISHDWKIDLNDKQIRARLLNSSFVSNWLIILNFKNDETKQYYSCLILSDSIETDTFRRLKICFFYSIHYIHDLLS